jgi:N-acetyl-gamma-glutamyl-phosphate reductase
MNKIRVGIIGGGGYTGKELLRILLRHPNVEITAVTSDSYKGLSVAEVYPEFLTQTDLAFEKSDYSSLIGRVDTLFLCLPHGESMRVVPLFTGTDINVFDLSADYRVSDRAVYEKWYQPHSSFELVKEAVYGLAELVRENLKDKKLVAVPGCYPTASILALAPALSTGLIDLETVVINAVSGVSGAGKKPKTELMFAELDGDFYAYSAPNHRHTPEIEEQLSILAGRDMKVTFIPHILPTVRGINATITATLAKDIDRAKIVADYHSFYAGSKFVTITDDYPHLKWAVGGNGVFISVQVDERCNRLIITSAIDNLIKGASGQAVQCFNIANGFDETTGLV